MKPTHQARTFSASRIFTDRDDARSIFLKAVQNSQLRDEYRVLNWYGIGGQGKSALCNELQETLKRLQHDHTILSVYRNFRWACANFEDATMRQLETATLVLRLQLARNGGMSFPAFDVAFARYFALINPGVDMRQRHPELFKSDSEILGDLIDWSKEGVEASTTLASMLLPGANILYKYGARLAGSLGKWWERRGKQILEGLDDLNADQVRQRLPTYLGADIYDHLASSPSDRIVVFLDTYEALWRDRGSNADYSGIRVDEWVRKLVQESAGVLFVIFGRDAIRWGEIDPEWSQIVSGHPLGLLSDSDSLRFLKSIPIDNPQICERIVRSSRGLPFYLNLQVDLYEKLVNTGNAPAPDQFGGSHPEILARFIDHLGKEEPQLRLASYPRILDEKIMVSLMDRFLGGSALLDWKSFCSRSFITATLGDRVAMHAVMRDALQANELERRPAVFHEVHRYLANLFDQMAKVGEGKSFDVESDALIIAAAEHLTLVAPEEFPAWFKERWDSLWLADRLRVLKRVLEKVLSEDSNVTLWEPAELAGILVYLARVHSQQGNYDDATTCLERALSTYRSIENSIDKTVIAEVLFALNQVLDLSELDRREALVKEASTILSNSNTASLEMRIGCETTLAELARLRGDLDSTRHHYEAARELLRQKSDAAGIEDAQPSRERMEWLSLMGTVSIFLEQIKDAQQYFETALRYADALIGPLDAETVSIALHYNLTVYVGGERDSFDTAASFLHSRLQEVEKLIGDTHPINLGYLDEISKVRKAQGRAVDEVEVLNKCLEIAIKIYGEESVQVTHYRIRLMAPLIRLEKPEECIKLAESIDMDRLLEPGTLEDWEKAAVSLAQAYSLTDQNAAALELLNKGISLYDELKIKHSNSYLQLLQERADTLAALGDKQRALHDSNQQVILTRELQLPLPILLAASYCRHASILERFREFSEASAFYRKALEVMDENYQQPMPTLFQILKGLEDSLRALGFEGAALAVQKRRFVTESASGMSTREKLLGDQLALIKNAIDLADFAAAELQIQQAKEIAQHSTNESGYSLSCDFYYGKLCKEKLQLNDARAILEQVHERLLGEFNDAGWLNRVEKELIQVLTNGGVAEEAEHLAQRRFDGPFTLQSWRWRVDNMLLLAACARNTNKLSEAARLCKEGIVIAESGEKETNEIPYWTWRWLTEESEVLKSFGQLDLASKNISNVVSAMKSYRHIEPNWVGTYCLRLATLQLLGGKPAEAEQLAREALSQSRRYSLSNESSPSGILQIPYLGLLGLSLYELAREAEALEVAQSVMKILEADSDIPRGWDLACEAIEVLVRNHQQQGRVSDATQLLKTAQKKLEVCGITNHIALARYMTLEAWVQKQDEVENASALAEKAFIMIAARYGPLHPYAKRAQALGF